MPHAPAAPRPTPGLACGEVRGGNGVTYAAVGLPGLEGIIYSRPCTGVHGGDIHYLSRCGSGLLARVCLADVAGHGPVVAAVGREMHDHLRRSVDVVDERKVFERFNRRLDQQGLSGLTTAVLVTYYPPSRRLTVSYAGHPRGWLYRAASQSWEPLTGPERAPARRPAYIDVPLGVGLPATFNRHRFRVAPGDRVLLVTDGVLETTSPANTPLDTHGVEGVLRAAASSVEALATRLLDALHAHAEQPDLAHDDVTFFVGEFTEGPAGPALWHV
ncbi:MAG: PP2C family protein-serine/threonine phosphatase, partial [Vicinamibacterales bacterium]